MKKLGSHSVYLFLLFFVLQSAACKNVKELQYKGIQSTKLQTLSLNNAALRVNLQYFNPNNFALDVKETNLSVYLNNKFVGIADQPEKTQIPQRADFIFPVVAHFEPLKVLGSAFKTLFSSNNTIRLQGTAKLGKGGIYIKVPINIEEKIELSTN